MLPVAFRDTLPYMFPEGQEVWGKALAEIADVVVEVFAHVVDFGGGAGVERGAVNVPGYADGFGCRAEGVSVERMWLRKKPYFGGPERGLRGMAGVVEGFSFSLDMLGAGTFCGLTACYGALE